MSSAGLQVQGEHIKLITFFVYKQQVCGNQRHNSIYNCSKENEIFRYKSKKTSICQKLQKADDKVKEDLSKWKTYYVHGLEDLT